MKKEESKIDFDLSALTLSELTMLYENVSKFVQFLEEKKIVVEEKGEEDDE